MKKYLFIMAFSLIGSYYSLCQEIENSLLLDSLHRILPTLKDSSRVDCLNALSENSIYWPHDFKPEEFRRSADSIYKYAGLAYKEATRINYKYGIANSLLNFYNSYRARAGMLRDSIYVKAVRNSLLVKYRREALALALEIGNNELLGKIYSMCDFDTEVSRVENYKNSIYYYRKAGDEKKVFMVMTYLTNEFDYSNEESLAYADSSLQLARKIMPTSDREHELIQTAFANMGLIFEKAGDYESALTYMIESDNYSKTHSGPGRPIQISEVYYLMGKYDSALYYWEKWKKDYDTYYYGFQAFGNTLLGKIYLKTMQTDPAIHLFKLSLKTLEKNGKYDTLSPWGLIQPLIYLAGAYYQKKNYNVALSYARQGLYFANLVTDKGNLLEGNNIISKIYHQIGKNDSAYNFLLKYVDLKDSIVSKQFLFKVSNYKKQAEDAKKESRIGFLDRDNKLKQQELKQEATFRNFIIAAFFALLFAGLYIFRNINLKRKNERLRQEQKEQEWKMKELENENRHVELQRQSTALEMQALRAQMNPHFIFNSLSSINHFILRNESKTASTYLTRFSRLIRMVLINSQKTLITLNDELEMLRIYLEMERLRFKNSFDYGITFLNAIDSDNIYIPPLLLQPFCENAIWHGLMNKDGQGRLDIELSMGNNTLTCTITDNGIGRKKAEEMKSKSAEKEKSMGLKITADRLSLLNAEKGITTFYTIEDITDEDGNATGTRVNLKINCAKTTEVINQ